MHPISPYHPPDIDDRKELLLWLWLLGSARNPPAVLIILTLAALYGCGKLLGLMAARPFRLSRAAATDPDPRRRSRLRAAGLSFLLACGVAALLLVAGYLELGLIVFSVGLLLAVILAERASPPQAVPPAIPMDISVEDVIAWGRNPAPGSTGKNGTAPAPVSASVSPVGVSSNGKTP